MIRTLMVVQLICSHACDVLGLPTDPPRRTYQLTEEEPVGTFVADLRADFMQPDVASDEQQLRFVILTPEGELGRRLFSIEPPTGLVRTATVVDRDSICPGEVDCVVELDVGVQPRHFFQLLKLAVEIVDINDHSPRFPSSRVELEVSEATIPGVLFHISPAEDADGPHFGIAGYRVVSTSRHFDVRLPDPDAPFESPLLVLLEPLDRELQDLHQLKIVAEDGGNPPRSGSVLLDIVVIDVNDNVPEFDKNSYKVDIVENSPASSSILSVTASDPDLGPNADVVYAFSRQSYNMASSMFGLDPTTGVISSVVPLDFEATGSSYTFDVVASNAVDGSSAIRTSTARVTVNIVDVNDNAPSLRIDAAVTGTGNSNKVISVPENCPPDSVVAHLSVTDPDTGLGGQVDCALTGNPVHFRLVHIYDAEFQLLTSSSATLDREAADHFRLVIVCHDNAERRLSSSVELDIEVEDVDDNIPQFSRAVYNFAMNESTAPGSVIGRVMATDADTGSSAQSPTLRSLICHSVDCRYVGHCHDCTVCNVVADICRVFEN